MVDIAQTLFEQQMKEGIAAPYLAAFNAVAEDLRDPAEPRVEAVGNKHPKTARAAAALVAPKAGSERTRILDALLVREQRYEAAFTNGNERLPPRGFTAAEAAEVIGSSRNQTAARLLTLRSDGWLVYAVNGKGEEVARATDAAGRFSGKVHVFTAAGRAQWEQRSRG